MSLTGMRQRCWVHDYCAPSFYMLTIVTEPRRGCLSEVGELGRHAAGPGELLSLSSMGEVVQEVWGRTSTVYSGVEARECVVMPDHFHGILWVKERQKRHVGHIVKAFKRVSERECRSKGLLPPNLGPAAGSTLWQEGYQEPILLRKGQLEAMSRYIADNPRRLAMKRANPGLFTVVGTQTVGQGRACPAIGNRFLLDRPVKRQVQVSRRISQEALADKKAELLYAAEHGAVLVSPCISPGETEIARAAQDAGLPLIVLLANGFAPLYKPPGRYFDACAAGHLLMLAPFPYYRETRAITREQCLALNEWAELIAAP